MPPYRDITGGESVFKSAGGRNAILATYGDILSRWPVPHDTVSVPTRHGETFVIRCGDSAHPPLVLLHGSSTNACMWIGDVAEYCKGYRVYAVDIPGEPGMSEPIRCDLGTSAPAEWLDDVLASLDARKATLVGLSLGGWFAVKYASSYPNRVERLVLLCPGGICRPRVRFTLAVMVLPILGRRGLERIMRMVNGSQRMPAEAIEYSLLIASNFRPRRDLPLFNDDELKGLTMPVLLVVGARDALFDSRKTVARLSGLVPHLTESVLPEAGHALVNLSGHVMSLLDAQRQPAIP